MTESRGAAEHTPDGLLACRSCPKKPYPWPARYMASAKRINDLPPLDWPVCDAHMQHAMVAGWFPIRTLEEWRAEQPDAPVQP